MSDVTNVARIMDGLYGPVRRSNGAQAAPAGRLIVAGRFYETTDALNRIAQALGWVQERIDAVRTNFNDLDYDSPLTRTVSFAGGSDKTWLFIVTDVNDRFLTDAPSFRRLDSIALRGLVVVVAERLPAEAPEDWAMLDLEARTA